MLTWKRLPEPRESGSRELISGSAQTTQPEPMSSGGNGTTLGQPNPQRPTSRGRCEKNDLRRSFPRKGPLSHPFSALPLLCKGLDAQGVVSLAEARAILGRTFAHLGDGQIEELLGQLGALADVVRRGYRGAAPAPFEAAAAKRRTTSAKASRSELRSWSSTLNCPATARSVLRSSASTLNVASDDVGDSLAQDRKRAATLHLDLWAEVER